MDLVGFECPLRGEKKLLLEKNIFTISVKVNIYLKPCISHKSENGGGTNIYVCIFILYIYIYIYIIYIYYIYTYISADNTDQNGT